MLTARRLSVRIAMTLLYWGCCAVALAQPAGKTEARPEALRLMLRAADVVAVKEFYGPATETKASFEVVAKAVLSPQGPLVGKLTAFEEQRFFAYALGETGLSWASPPDGSGAGPALLRRFWFLKPSVFVIDDRVCPAPSAPLRWSLEVQGRPEPGPRPVRAKQGAWEVVCTSLLPEQAGQTRFLHVLEVRGEGEPSAPAKAELFRADGVLQVTVRTPDRTFQLWLPEGADSAGKIAVAQPDGGALLERRPLPSGILPHGPEGSALLERWDASYRGGRRAAWDTGRPSSDLKKAVEQGILRPCRALELGCGTGTNAIYLASKGFDVTAIDIAPTALNLAQDKARQAGAKVRWLLADVLHPPQLEPFDLIYDRGCYHGVRRQNAAGYVEAVCRLSRPGTRLLILAGNANETARGGPPRVKEEELRADFSERFQFEWLRQTHFDTFDADARGALAWSILLRRKGEQ